MIKGSGIDKVEIAFDTTWLIEGVQTTCPCSMQVDTQAKPGRKGLGVTWYDLVIRLPYKRYAHMRQTICHMFKLHYVNS